MSEINSFRGLAQAVRSAYVGKVQPDPKYDFVPPLPSDGPCGTKLGSQCGECGAKFDYGKAYGFVCGNQRCPVQMKPTC